MAKAPSKTDQKPLEEVSKPEDVLDWKVVEAAWIGPHFRKVGAIVQMTQTQAAYYVPHILQAKGGGTAVVVADAAKD